MTKTTASGVNLTPVSIKGKDYIPVSMRIAEVNASSMIPRFQILESRFFEFGGLNLCQVTVEIEGRLFKGTASVNIGGRGVDATNPIENAETSALGRALGLAGFGSLESVASAEEVVAAVSRSESGYKPQPDVMPDITPVEPEQSDFEKALERLKSAAKNVGMDPQNLADYLKKYYNITWKGLNESTANKVASAIENSTVITA